METYTLIVLLLAATIRVATPLLLAAIAGLFSERSGVIDLGLEGKMLGAAFAAAAVSATTGSVWFGLGAGIATAVGLALLIGYACITHRGNQVVAGMAVTIMVVGLGPTLGLAWFNLGGQTPQLDGAGQRFTAVVLPWAQAAREVPFPGLIYSELLSGQNLLVYFAAALVPMSAWVFYRTRFGLRLRAVGENPHAVDTAGISVNGLRYQAVIISGVLCGVAGTYLSTAASSGFVRDMTAGKGYLALAALIFGKWKPVPTLGACLLFAFTDALATRLQGVALPVVGVIPVQFILALPYALTVLLLAGFVGKAVAPKAIGVPYSKGKMSSNDSVQFRLARHLGQTPDTAQALFVAANATVVGDVVLGPSSSVFYGAVLGDIQEIRVGEGSNIQDNAVVHLADAHGAHIGAWCTIGHAAIIHACTIEDECLIGMGATVLDGARIGARSIVGANSLVPQRFTCPPGSMVYGAPAKVVRALTEDEQRGLRAWAEKYVEVAKAHAALPR